MARTPRALCAFEVFPCSHIYEDVYEDAYERVGGITVCPSRPPYLPITVLYCKLYEWRDVVISSFVSSNQVRYSTATTATNGRVNVNANKKEYRICMNIFWSLVSFLCPPFMR